MQLTPRYGYTGPSDSDPLDADELTRTLDSINGVIRAGSAVQAAQKVAKVSLPALVLRTDNDTLWLYSTDRPSGEQIAGRGHGAHWVGSGSANPGELFALSPTSFVRASAGFAMAEDYQVRLPATGIYAFSVSNKMTGQPYSGRSFVELLINNAVLVRFPGAGDNDWGGAIVWPVAAGDLVKVQGYHLASDRRSFNCQVVCAQVNNPSWVDL